MENNADTPKLNPKLDPKLDKDNFQKGLLIDEELLAGVTPHPEKQDTFVAFIIRHETGEYLGYQDFSSLDDALATINKIDRSWMFQPLNPCSGHHHDSTGESTSHGCGGSGGCGGCGH